MVNIVGLSYFSFYVEDISAAVQFYTSLFGEPGYTEGDGEVYGWKMGSTWLTLFPAASGPEGAGNPRNAEFAIQVSSSEEVDALYEMLLTAGARSCRTPSDTVMYRPMRFACVDDPFGLRIDVYWPSE